MRYDALLRLRRALARSVTWVAVALAVAMPLGAVAQDRADEDATPPATAAAQPVLARALKVGVIEREPFVMAKDGTYRGLAIDLWERIQGSLGSGSQYEEFPSAGALLEALEQGRIDAAVGNISITGDRVQRVAFTQPWFDGGLRIMTLKQRGFDLSRLWLGLSQAGYLRILGWMIGALLFVTLMQTVINRRSNPEFTRRWSLGFAQSLYQVISAVTKNPNKDEKRIGVIASIWATFVLVGGLLLVAFLTSAVTSVMTTLALSRGVNSLADLEQTTVAVFKGSSSAEYLADRGIATHEYADLPQAVEALQAGDVAAIVADASVLEYHVHTQPRAGLVVRGNLFRRQTFGFAFAQGSPLETPATVQLLDLQKRGVTERLRLEYFGNVE